MTDDRSDSWMGYEAKLSADVGRGAPLREVVATIQAMSDLLGISLLIIEQLDLIDQLQSGLSPASITDPESRKLVVERVRSLGSESYSLEMLEIDSSPWTNRSLQEDDNGAVLHSLPGYGARRNINTALGHIETLKVGFSNPVEIIFAIAASVSLVLTVAKFLTLTLAQRRLALAQADEASANAKLSRAKALKIVTEVPPTPSLPLGSDDSDRWESLTAMLVLVGYTHGQIEVALAQVKSSQTVRRVIQAAIRHGVAVELNSDENPPD